MPSVADLTQTIAQERMNAEEYLTMAKSAEKRGDTMRADEYRNCAALCYVQAEQAEQLLNMQREMAGL